MIYLAMVLLPLPEQPMTTMRWGSRSGFSFGDAIPVLTREVGDLSQSRWGIKGLRCLLLNRITGKRNG